MSLSNLLVRSHLWFAGHAPRPFARTLARVHPSVRSLEHAGDCWKLTTRTGEYFLSDPRQVTRFVGIGTKMMGRVLEKYTAPGFVEVEPGDTIVDVGAFIGEFSRPAGEIGSRVVAVEPDERNAAALECNLAHLQSADVIRRAAWTETGTREFQVAGDPSEGSLLSVDDNDVTDVVTLDTVRIDDLVEELELDNIDYLKIEAEGAEPEVLSGVGSVNVSKIAVECAPEREGRAPTAEVREWLVEQGYDVETKNHIVFGALPP